jgi:DNA-binding transcriptional ArsR family regulator
VQSVLDAVAEPKRREILRLVRDQELPAGAIAARFPNVSRPTVSEHLRVLREAGLLVERRVGTKRLYRTRAAGFDAVRAFLDEFWDVKLQGLKVEAEREQRRRDGSRPR